MTSLVDSLAYRVRACFALYITLQLFILRTACADNDIGVLEHLARGSMTLHVVLPAGAALAPRWKGTRTRASISVCVKTFLFASSPCGSFAWCTKQHRTPRTLARALPFVHLPHAAPLPHDNTAVATRQYHRATSPPARCTCVAASLRFRPRGVFWSEHATTILPSHACGVTIRPTPQC